MDLGYNFDPIGGGVDRFLTLDFSKVAARAVNAGDRPLTRSLSGLKDTLLERCDFSGAEDLPPYEAGILLFGFYEKKYIR